MIPAVVVRTLVVLLVAAAWSPRPVRAGAVVGTGKANSCTETALDAALAAAGNITFKCGASPVTITVTSTKTISADTTIDGGSLLTISGGNSVGVFYVNTGVTFTVQNLTIANGNSAVGGGISNGEINGEGSIVVGGTLTVTNSTFSNNSAVHGGAIYNSGGTVRVASSTFSGNSATGYYGGAIDNYIGGTVTVTNSTFSGNSATGAGGAIANYRGALTNPGGMVRVSNSTFWGNSATGYYGGTIFNSSNGSDTLTVINSIVANSTSGANCAGSVTDGGHNIDDGTTCGFSTANGSLNNTNPKLDSAGLTNNGGPTQTIALQARSPAINAGNEAVCAAPPVNDLDQRGYGRPGTGATSCSIGAYEFSSPGPPCCQCPTSCAAPINGSCGDCVAVARAVCEGGHLCVLNTPMPSPTPTPIPTPAPTSTNTPGTNDCCRCAGFCAAPIAGTCGGCAVVLGASCGTEGLCVSRPRGGGGGGGCSMTPSAEGSVLWLFIPAALVAWPRDHGRARPRPHHHRQRPLLQLRRRPLVRSLSVTEPSGLPPGGSFSAT